MRRPCPGRLSLFRITSANICVISDNLSTTEMIFLGLFCSVKVPHANLVWTLSSENPLTQVPTSFSLVSEEPEWIFELNFIVIRSPSPILMEGLPSSERSRLLAREIWSRETSLLQGVEVSAMAVNFASHCRVEHENTQNYVNYNACIAHTRRIQRFIMTAPVGHRTTRISKVVQVRTWATVATKGRVLKSNSY